MTEHELIELWGDGTQFGMTELRLCEDCKHYKRDWSARITGYGDTFDVCLHPLVTENVVTEK